MEFRICGRLLRFVLGGRDKMNLGSGGMRWRAECLEMFVI